ncbi:MAG: ParA family protein [Waddliaceae bacterium]
MGKRARIISFTNHKGGVGKTCTTCNVGAGLALNEKKVLLVDLDPQANLSLSFGMKVAEKAESDELNIYNVLVGDCRLGEIVSNVGENLDLCPSSLDLAGAELELVSFPGREIILRKHLQVAIENYDYVLIDCPPALGVLTYNALAAADDVFLPIQAEYLAVKGIDALKRGVGQVKEGLNPHLNISGVIITQFDSRKILHREVASIIERFFEVELFKTKIRNNVSLAEASLQGQDIFRYSPKSNGAEDYWSLCEEILARHPSEVCLVNC